VCACVRVCVALIVFVRVLVVEPAIKPLRHTDDSIYGTGCHVYVTGMIILP